MSGVREREVEVVKREVVLHGQRITYLEAGVDSGGPVVVLLHGLAGSSATWLPVLPALGRCARVIAPDLLGHGQSGKPRDGDYSLGAHAAGVRDLLVVLGLQAATVIGHSFGGGVATQFTYHFPELTERLVLVASGGLGREVSPALRAATFPGTRAHSSSPDSRLDVFPAAGHFPPATTPPASPGRPRLPRHDSTSHADVEQVRHRLRATAGPERIGRAVDGAGATPLRLTMARTPIRAP